MDTLIGHTGFIGKNFSKRSSFNLYNSKNIHMLSEKQHNVIFCAAPSAEKWKINVSPEEDLNNINTILLNLKSSSFKKIVLFSTIDVYDNTVNFDESHEILSCNHNYGKNRLYFEKEIKKFPNWIIIRLPGLFGNELKKNVIFDLLNDNILGKINLNDRYQWYFIDWLFNDVQLIINSKNKIFNFFTEPVENEIIINDFFPFHDKSFFIKSIPFKNYDLKTLNKQGGYFKTKQEVLEKLNLYIENEKSKK